MAAHHYAPIPDVDIAADAEHLQNSVKVAKREVSYPNRVVSAAFADFCDCTLDMLSQLIQNITEMVDKQSGWLEPHNVAKETIRKILAVADLFDENQVEGLDELCEVLAFIKQKSAAFRSENRCCGMFVGVHAKQIADASGRLKALGVKLKLQEFLDWRSQPPRNQPIETVPPETVIDSSEGLEIEAGDEEVEPMGMEGGDTEGAEESNVQSEDPLIEIDEQEVVGEDGDRSQTALVEIEEQEVEVDIPEADVQADESVGSVVVEEEVVQDFSLHSASPAADVQLSDEKPVGELDEGEPENLAVKPIERQGSIPVAPAVKGEEADLVGEVIESACAAIGPISDAPTVEMRSKIPTPPPSPLPVNIEVEENLIDLPICEEVVAEEGDSSGSQSLKQQEEVVDSSGISGLASQGAPHDLVVEDAFEPHSRIPPPSLLDIVDGEVGLQQPHNVKTHMVAVEVGEESPPVGLVDRYECKEADAKHSSSEIFVESQQLVDLEEKISEEIRGECFEWTSRACSSRIPTPPERSTGGGTNGKPCDQSKVVGHFKMDKIRSLTSRIPPPPGMYGNEKEALGGRTLLREASFSSRKTLVESIPEESGGDIYWADVVTDEEQASPNKAPDGGSECSVDVACVVPTVPAEEGVAQLDVGVLSLIEGKVLDRDSPSMCTIVKGDGRFCVGWIIRHFLERKRIVEEFGGLVFSLRAGEVSCDQTGSRKLLDLFHRKLLMAGRGSEIDFTSNLSGGWDVESLIYQCREILAGRRCLLIIEDLVKNHVAVLEPFLVLGIGILATSPSMEDISGSGDSSVSVVEVDRLPESDALRFFRQAIGEGFEKESHHDQSIVNSCRGNFSGLLVSAALVNHRVEWEAVSKMAATREIASKFTGGDFNTLDGKNIPELSVCIDRLPECDRELFARLSAFPSNTAIPAVIIRGVWGEPEPADLARKLAMFETLLLVWCCGEGRWLLDENQHALAELQANSDGNREGLLLESTHRMAECVSQPGLFKVMFLDDAQLLVKYFGSMSDVGVIEFFLKQGKAHLDSDREFVGNVVEFLLALGDLGSAEQLGNMLLDRMSDTEVDTSIQQAMKLSSTIAIALERRGCPSDAESIWRMISDLARMMDKPKCIELADSLTNLALIVVEDAKFEEAVKLLTEALELWRSLLGTKHPKTVSVCVKLQETRFCRGESVDMELTLRESLECKQMIWGGTSPRLFQPIEKLAPLILTRDGDVEEVLELHAQLVAIIDRLTGDERKKCARLLWELTQAVQSRGSPDSMENALLECHEKLETALEGADEDLIVDVLGSFGSILDAQGKHQQAISKLQKAVSIVERTRGENDVSVASARNNLACVLFHAGDLAGAESLHRKALEVRRKTYGEIDERVAVSIGNLGNVLEAAERHAEAEDCMRNALEVWIRLMGEENALVATALNNLGMVLESRNKLNEAEKIHRKALELWVKINGENDLTVASAESTLANVLEGLQKYDEAEAVYRKALDMYERDPNADDVMVASAMNNLALALENCEKLDEAESVHRKALSLWQRTKGEHNPDVITSMTNLAFVLEGKEDFEGAEELLRKAVKLCKSVHGANHPEVCGAMENLAGVLESGNKQEEADKLRVSAMFWKQKYYQSQP
ncbi:hypothetical protein BSKO_03035 [Bryopsis sp. KO-2023]|nr:hypothetical protein BSKO_03035 [Bryopsis sp. KO-2023]